ncbi:MAG: flagellar biosynthetic protein FliO [Myxococcales bacterium]
MGTALLLQQAATGSAYGSYAADLLRTLVALGAVCLLAWVGLRLLSRRGFGRGDRDHGPVQVVHRVPLGPRQSLLLVRAGDRALLVGVGESGPPALLTELDPSALDPSRPPTPASDGGEEAARRKGEP